MPQMWCSIGATSSGRSGPVRAGSPGYGTCTRSPGGDAATVCAAFMIGARLGVRIGATIWTTSDAPTITRSMLDLCSAPCKALRFASTAHAHRVARGLRALTVPARRSRLGHYVMAGGVMMLSGTDLGR